MRHAFGHVQPVTQLDGVEQIGIEHAGAVGNFDALEAFFQLGQFIDGFLHQFRRAVNTAAFFHRHAHLVADFGPVLVAFLFHQVAQAGFDVAPLCIQCTAVGRAGFQRAASGLLTGHPAEHHQFRQ
ncbi:hypothetical protein D3C80_1741830 [compost metagenome]